MKKSVISVLFSAALLVMFSVNAFAEVPFHPLPDYPMINVEDGDTVIGTLKTSELTEAQKNYLRRWLTSPNNICSFSGEFVMFSIVSENDDDTYFQASTNKALSIIQNPGFSYITFSLTTGELYMDESDGAHLNSGLGFIFSGNYFKSHPPTFSNASIIGYEGRLLMRDDGGIFGEEEIPESSSSPDAPPDFKPEPPSDPFVPPSAPSFDFGGTTGDLPYDSSIWEALMWYLRDTIGSVGTVLLWVLMIIIAIPTVISAIRHFMNQAGDDGNNTSGLI